MRRRVFTFIVRSKTSDAHELLVFRHRDYPDAGVQTPGGGIEPGETPEAAALREAFEETGARGLKIVRRIAQEVVPEWNTEAHVFHLAALEGMPDRWEHTSNDFHEVDRSGPPLVFSCFWAPMTCIGLLRSSREDRWIESICSDLSAAQSV